MKSFAKTSAHLPSILFVLVLVGYPIVAGLTAILDVETNALSIIYRAVVLVAAILLIVASLYREKLRVGLGIILGAAFLFLYSARMLVEGLLNPGYSNMDFKDFWIFFVLVCFIPALPFVWGDNKPSELLASRGVIFFGIVGLIVCFYPVYKSSDLPILGQLLSGRLESERLNPIAYGHLGVSVLIVSAWSLLIKREGSVLAVGGILLGGVGLLASGSRGPLLSLAVCGVLIIMLMGVRLAWLAALFASACVILFYLGWQAWGVDDIYLISRVANSMFEDSARVELFEAAYGAFIDNVIFGAAYPFDTYPHNIVFEAFMATGVLGGMLMIGVLLVGVASSIKLLKESSLSWVALLFMQYLVFVMVSSSIYYSNIFWMLWVCVVVLAKNMPSGTRLDFLDKQNLSKISYIPQPR